MQVSTTTTLPDAAPLEQQAVDLIGSVLPARITTPDQYTALGEELKAINTWIKEWDGHHDPIIASAHKTHRLALDAKAKYGAKAETRKKMIAQLLGAYDAAQRQLASQEADHRRRIQEAADRERRENELAAAQQREREANEARQKLENDAAAARQLVNDTPDLEQQNELLDIAANADREATDRGMEAAYERQIAEQIVSAPVVPAFVETTVLTPQVEGVSTRVTWFAEVADKKKYLEHVLANFALLENRIEILMPALNRDAVNAKKEIEIAPGVFARPKYGASAKA